MEEEASSSNGSTPKAKTVKRSCDSCRRRKLRCDGNTDQDCTRCKHAKIKCQFSAERRKRAGLRSYVQTLETKLQYMEELLNKIAMAKDLPSNNGSQHSSQSHSPFMSFQENRKTPEVENPSQGNPCFSMDEEYHSLAKQMEELAVSDYQHTLYLGSSLGAHLLSEELFDTSNKILQVPTDLSWAAQKISNDKENHLAMKTKDTMDSDVSSKGSTTSNFMDMFKDVPHHLTREFVDHLVYIYFTQIHDYNPIINKVQFLEQYYYNIPSPPNKYLLYAITWIGIHLFKKDPKRSQVFSFTQEQLDDIEESLKKKAHEILATIYNRPTISTVQTLMLISLYRQVASENEDIKYWLITGIAIRMAQGLGLHVDCSQWTIPEYEIELRKRIWYGLYIMDRFIALETGRPLSIIDHEFNIPLPSPYEIDYIPSIDQENNMSMPIPTLIAEAEKAFREKKPIYSFFVHAITLTQILGQILVGLHSTRPSQDYAIVESLVNALESSLASWRASLPPELQVDSSNIQNTRYSLQATTLHVVYEDALLLLYRPFIRKTQEPEYAILASKAMSVYASAAKDILFSVELIRKGDPSISPWRSSVFALFQAAIAFLQLAKSEDESIRNQGVDCLRRCVHILLQDAHLKKAHPVRALAMLLNNIESNAKSDPVREQRVCLQDESISSAPIRDTLQSGIFPSQGNTTGQQDCIVDPNEAVYRDLLGSGLFTSLNTNMSMAPGKEQLVHQLQLRTAATDEILCNSNNSVMNMGSIQQNANAVLDLFTGLPLRTSMFDNTSTPYNENTSSVMPTYQPYNPQQQHIDSLMGNIILPETTQPNTNDSYSQLPMYNKPRGITWDEWVCLLGTGMDDSSAYIADDQLPPP